MSHLGQLDWMKIEGFKSIKSQRIELSELNILIGPNGVGKSNFISFFKMMNSLVERDLQSYIAHQLGADKILHFGRKQTKELSWYLKFRPNAYGAKLIPNTDGELYFEDEFCEFHGDEVNYKGGTKKYSLQTGTSLESRLPASPNTRSAKGHVTGYLKDWKVYHFHDTSDTAPVKQPCNINDNSFLRQDASNLAAFLYLIKETNEKSYQSIITTIQRVAPFFQDFVLEPDRRNEEMIRLNWKHKGSDAYFNANDLSDGTIRFICLVTLLLQPQDDKPHIILLDEPELGLHPFAIQVLATMMRSVSKNTQIIASTQSVPLANEFNPEDMIVVDRNKNATEFKRLKQEELKDWLQDYQIGQLWEMNVLGGTPE